MANEARQALEQRAQQAIINNAIFRWESAAVIALTVILTALAAAPEVNLILPWWVWLLGGGLAEAGLVYSSLTDEKANQKVVENMLRRQHNAKELQDEHLQSQIEEAHNYREFIERVIREKEEGSVKDELVQTADQLQEWFDETYILAQRLDRYYEKESIHRRNHERASKRILELQTQLNREKNLAVRQEIEHSIAIQTRQLDTVAQLMDSMERAKLRLENTIVAMGTIYAQSTLMGAKDIDSSRARRLRDDVAEEVRELADVLVTMDEVYSMESA